MFKKQLAAIACLAMLLVGVGAIAYARANDKSEHVTPSSPTSSKASLIAADDCPPCPACP